MENISVYALANYLANSVFKHYKRKSKCEIQKAFRNIKLFKKAHSGFFIKNPQGSSILNFKNVEKVKKAVNEKIELIQEDWNQEALNLKCVYANVSSNSKSISLLLDFRIRDGRFDILFGCEIGNNGVIDYFIEDYGGNHNEYYEIYKNALGHFTLPD